MNKINQSGCMEEAVLGNSNREMKSRSAANLKPAVVDLFRMSCGIILQSLLQKIPHGVKRKTEQRKMCHLKPLAKLCQTNFCRKLESKQKFELQCIVSGIHKESKSSSSSTSSHNM